MKLGLVSDAHGNFLAFKHTIDYLKKRGVDNIYFLGDALGYFPSVEVLEYLMANKSEITSLAGNHDLMYVNEDQLTCTRKRIYAYDKIRALIKPEHAQIIRELDIKIELNIHGRTFMLVHGGPYDHINQYVHDDTEVRFEANILVVGHTHRSFCKKIEQDKIILNVGSCGLPRDDGRFSTCATVDTEMGEIVIHRIQTKDLHLETLNRFKSFIDQDVHDLFERRSFHDSSTHSIRMKF